MKIKDKISTFIFYLSIFLFIFAFNFQHNPPSGWYQQFLPDIGGRNITDITFTDSLNGYAVTNDSSTFATILKTTNGGDNWVRNHEVSPFTFTRVQFINENTGFACGTKLLKTTNQGQNWINVNTPFQSFLNDFYVLNEDTIWFAMSESLTGGLFRTTNGGMNWTQQYSAGSNNPRKIYMYDSNTGFMSANGSHGLLLKTTNSGVNWVTISGEAGFTDIEFINQNTGWKARSGIQKSTDGGSNWFDQPLPQLNWLNTALAIKAVDKDTLWAVGGVIQWIPSTSNFRGVVYKTTNGGINWGYQIPDTGANYYQLTHIDFIDKIKGWAYLPDGLGFHTVKGGNDTTIFTSIQQINTEIPALFQLYQNYPNPFNPTTNIKFKIKSSKFISLKVYEVTGKEVANLVNENLDPGEYEYAFDGSKLTSGVYFYRLQIEDYSDTKKMLLVK